MAIFEGVVTGAGNLIESLGFDWLVGSVVPNATPIFVDIAVPDLYVPGSVFHSGGFSLLMPNDSVEHGRMAIALGQEALILIELAIALQSIMDPEGGVKLKDSLDPYHYNVVKNALEENGDPVPTPANPGATTLDKLGGAITESGLFTGIAAAAGTLSSLGTAFGFLSVLPQVTASPPGAPIGRTAAVAFPNLVGALDDIQTSVASGITGTGMPTNALALNISISAIQIKTAALAYITSLIRNAIDTKAGALLVKNVMSDFTLAVSKNAIEKTERTAPDQTQQEGESGIF